MRGFPPPPYRFSCKVFKNIDLALDLNCKILKTQG